MHYIPKVLITILIIFSMQSLNAQVQNYQYLTKVFEKDTSITLLAGVCSISICSYNFKFNKQFVEAILISPSEHIFKFPAIILLSHFETGANESIPTGIEFARQGFVCMTISQPGSGRSKGILDYAGKKTISAINAGYTKLRQESFVDPDKIGICGYDGGALTALTLAAELKDLKAAAFVSGIYDLNKANKDSLLHTGNISGEDILSRSPAVLINIS